MGLTTRDVGRGVGVAVDVRDCWGCEEAEAAAAAMAVEVAIVDCES